MAYLIAALSHTRQVHNTKGLIDKISRLRKEDGKSPFSLVIARAATSYKFDKDLDRLIAGLKLANIPEWVPPK